MYSSRPKRPVSVMNPPRLLRFWRSRPVANSCNDCGSPLAPATVGVFGLAIPSVSALQPASVAAARESAPMVRTDVRVIMERGALEERFGVVMA